MFIFEFTDEYIIIYNKKTKKIQKEEIPNNVIKKNKIYDFKKLLIIINKLVDKYQVINNLFKTKLYILTFFKSSPVDIYLYEQLFKNISNINLKIVNAKSLIDEKVILISGNYLYLNNEIIEINQIPNEQYILVGNSPHFNALKEKLNKTLNLYEYENSDTILYETVK